MSQKTIFGSVFNQDGEPLIAAYVSWDGTSIGAEADLQGNFSLPKMDTTAFLLISYVGYNPVYIEVFPNEDTVLIRVDGITTLSEVNVTGQSRGNFTSTLETANIETITSCELKNAACCNLAESFVTNGSVDVMQQDAITSTTEIQMLGLRGIYTQLLLEKRPAFPGLGSPLALEFVPGTWVSGIQISKGASTVQNGYQGIAGQINVEMAKPWQDKPFFLNLFGSTNERGEANLHLNKKWTKELSSGLLLHGSFNAGEFDRNDDTFLDLPKKKTLDGVWRNYYVTDVFSTQFNIQALIDERKSGQIFGFDSQPDPTPPYLIQQQNKRVDVFGKVGYVGFKEENTSVGFIYNASWHKTDNVFGSKKYNGTQRSLYTNLLYATALPNERHRLNFGASYQFDDYMERLDDTDFDRRESVPGVYAEYVLGNSAEKIKGLGVIAGIRLDHHNQFGWLTTPRLNLKYNFSDRSILRLSAGRGLRTAQILSENIAVLTSNRLLTVVEDLRMEDAWNAGMNFTQNGKLFGRNAGIVADLYRTNFRNQVVMDMETEAGKVLFYNLHGRSFSTSLLLLGSMNIAKGLNLKLAYKLNDVQTGYGYKPDRDRLPRQRPLNARHRGLFTLDYETPAKNWMLNLNSQFTGRQRFAHSHQTPEALLEHFQGNAPAYLLLNAQVTRRFKNLELYVGGENLTNYTQRHAIVDWEHPFGEHFDAMQVWAPLIGARGYAGLRWTIE